MQEMNKEINKEKECLFVDLDGTLIKGDLLYECLISIIKKSFFSIFFIPIWLLKGKAYLKEKFSLLIELNVELLPYNQEVVAYIKAKKEKGIRIILATASNHNLAKPISGFLGLFDDVIASNKKENLKGKNKLKKIKSYLSDNNFSKEFSYIGDSTADIVIFNEAKEPIIVGNEKIYNKIKLKNKNAKFIAESAKFSITSFLSMIRTYQWVKNLLIFIPLILSHKFLNIDLVLKAIVAFFSFSFLASSVYIINDIFDINADRMHPSKKHRAIASGDIPISLGLKTVIFLIPFSIVISLSLGKEFLLILTLYFITTTLYSIFFKKIVLVDILILSLLYTVRILAGGVALNIALSPWLAMFSLFMFFSLACAKRYAELYAVKNNLQHKIMGRGYQASDLEQIQIFGSSSGYIAVLIFALYIQSDVSVRLYKTPSFLWGLCPLMLYWISRVWLISHRGQMEQDPIIFAMKDKASYIILVFVVIIFVVAKYA
ncbi:MAG: UbiA family prenyltransferase [Bdellovibrionota bacterium]